jgi:hypothetical protein
LIGFQGICNGLYIRLILISDRSRKPNLLLLMISLTTSLVLLGFKLSHLPKLRYLFEERVELRHTYARRAALRKESAPELKVNNAGGFNRDEVGRWLRETVGLPQYAETFRSSNVHGAAFLNLSESSLTGIGVESRCDRAIILAHHAKLELAASASAFNLIKSNTIANTSQESMKEASGLIPQTSLPPKLKDYTHASGSHRASIGARTSPVPTTPVGPNLESATAVLQPSSSAHIAVTWSKVSLQASLHVFSSGEASPRLTDDGYLAEPISNGEAAPIIAGDAMMGERVSCSALDLGSAEHGAAASLVSSPASLAPVCDADAAVPKAEHRATDEANSTAQPKHGVLERRLAAAPLGGANVMTSAADVRAGMLNTEAPTPKPVKSALLALLHTQRKSLAAVLDALDRNHDGVISATELHERLVSLGVRIEPGMLSEIMRRADGDGDGQLTRSELENKLHSYATAEHAARVQSMLAEAGSVLSRETLAGPLRPETLLGPLRPGAGCSVCEQPAKGGVDDSSMPWSDVDECDLDSVFGWT